MPTPPKETIGGRKGHQINAFDFSKNQYNYIVNLESFSLSEEFKDLKEIEQEQIRAEIDQQNCAYETLRRRVENY